MPDSVYVVMPAHNEGSVIENVIDRVRAALPESHIVVVNDGSDDNTASQAAAAGAKVINLPFNCGYGVALHTGLTSAFRAGAEIAVILDADGQHEPACIARLMDIAAKGLLRNKWTRSYRFADCVGRIV